MTQGINLEYEIAKISYTIAKDQIIDKNIVDKALGILVNDGIYAMWLFIEEKGEKKENPEKSQGENDRARNKTNPKEFCEKIKELLEEIKLINSCDCSDFEKRKECFEQLIGNLNKLLLARQILERLLIYVRHQYKALGED